MKIITPKINGLLKAASSPLDNKTGRPTFVTHPVHDLFFCNDINQCVPKVQVRVRVGMSKSHVIDRERF